MEDSELLKKFSDVETTDFPDFYKYDKPLEMGLWILWIAKEKLQIKRMTSEQIALIIRDVKEISIDAKSINNAFTRARYKVHIYHEDGIVYFEIMKPGKDYLLSLIKEGAINLFYFESGKKYTSKKILSNHILDNLKGELKIVDPFCGERTLDILKYNQNNPIKILTRLINLKERDKNSFLREFRDFKSEYPNVEVRDYPNNDLHDRYVISPDFLVIIGHSIKDLGSKESFAIILNRETSRNIIESLLENFNRRWKQSNAI